MEFDDLEKPEYDLFETLLDRLNFNEPKNTAQIPYNIEQSLANKAADNLLEIIKGIFDAGSDSSSFLTPEERTTLKTFRDSIKNEQSSDLINNKVTCVDQFRYITRRKLGIIQQGDENLKNDVTILNVYWKNYIDLYKKEVFFKNLVDRSLINCIRDYNAELSIWLHETTMNKEEGGKEESSHTLNLFPSDYKPFIFEDSPSLEKGNEKTKPIKVDLRKKTNISAKKVEKTPWTDAGWIYLPIPKDPDEAPEYLSKKFDCGSNMQLMGARVRGRKHKHEGLNCDDWFEFGKSGQWIIIAVADGAGSALFSRIGARVACEEAVHFLEGALQNCSINEIDLQNLQRSEKRIFPNSTIEELQNNIHSAFRVAYWALYDAAQERETKMFYNEKLGRQISARDLSTTLLIAVHTKVLCNGQEKDLVLSCQVGDGAIGAISLGMSARILGVPDSGDFAGETEFITSPKKLCKANLRLGTDVFLGTLRALFVMSDGVADDYAFSENGIKNLLADLFLNGILPIFSIEESALPEEINDSMNEWPQIQRITDGKGPKNACLRSINTLLQSHNLEINDILKNRKLIELFSLGDPMYEGSENSDALEKLVVWLDSYLVRGSFDDRTLVILYKDKEPN